MLNLDLDNIFNILIKILNDKHESIGKNPNEPFDIYHLIFVGTARNLGCHGIFRRSFTSTKA